MYALKKNKQASEASEQRERQQASVSTEAGYVLRKSGRKIKTQPFSTYEEARQEARKRIRKDTRKAGMTKEDKWRFGWDRCSRNPPSISDFGYSVHKVS